MKTYHAMIKVPSCLVSKDVKVFTQEGKATQLVMEAIKKELEGVPIEVKVLENNIGYISVQHEGLHLTKYVISKVTKIINSLVMKEKNTPADIKYSVTVENKGEFISLEADSYESLMVKHSIFNLKVEPLDTAEGMESSIYIEPQYLPHASSLKIWYIDFNTCIHLDCGTRGVLYCSEGETLEYENEDIPEEFRGLSPEDRLKYLYLKMKGVSSLSSFK